MQNYLSLAIYHWKKILFAGLILALLFLLASFLFPLEYRADAQVLIISRSRYGVDPYTTIKSAERIGENLVQIMKTNDFFSKVINQPGYEVDKSFFENVSERSKRKRWQKSIEASMVYGTGVLNISAYSRDKEQAGQLAGAAAAVLVAYGWEYVGGDVTIKVVNEPMATRFPARPNLVLNAVLGFVLGVLGMGLIVYRSQPFISRNI